jgi:pimeloyl-ACP methyl ester carboxylesterase
MDTRFDHERTSHHDEMLQHPALAKHPHLLVVIDHREARVYRTELHGTLPQRVVPYDPYGYGRQLRYVRDESKGLRKPERGSFYAAVAGMLQAAEAEAILLFGHGTGASSAMSHLLAELKQHHAGLAKRVVGAIVVDQAHLTEDQLLAKARECYANASL